MTFDNANDFDLFGRSPGWDNGQSYDQPISDGSSLPDIAQSSSGFDTGAASNSQWGGFFQSTLNQVIGYGIARDAARNGVVLRPPTPLASSGYTPQLQRSQAQPNSLLLVLLGVGAAYLVLKK
jgi:hypothetical protein